MHLLRMVLAGLPQHRSGSCSAYLGPPAGEQDVLGNSHKESRPISQLKDALDLALAVGWVPDQAGSVVVMQSPCQDFAGAGGVAIQQHHQRHLVDGRALIQVHSLREPVENRFGALKPGRSHKGRQKPTKSVQQDAVHLAAQNGPSGRQVRRLHVMDESDWIALMS